MSQDGVVGDPEREEVDISSSKTFDNLLDAEEAVDISPRLGRPLDFLVGPTGKDERELA